MDESHLSASSNAQDSKHVKVVAYAPAKADYMAYDHKGKFYKVDRIQGSEVYEYDLTEDNGMHISLLSPEGHPGYVSLEVYEDGVLVRQKEDDEFGLVTVWYRWRWSRM